MKLVVAGVAALVALLSSHLALAHDPDTIQLEVVDVDPSCHLPDQPWQVTWRLTNQSSNPFDIVDTTLDGDPIGPDGWSANPVPGGTSVDLTTEHPAGEASVNLVVVHANEVHEAQGYGPEVAFRPEDCEPEPSPTPTQTSTSTPTSTATPLPTIALFDFCHNIEGQQLSVPDGLEWKGFDCVVPVPTPIPAGSITPPSTGSAGLR